jgi:hypothetical protein
MPPAATHAAATTATRTQLDRLDGVLMIVPSLE